MVELTLAAQTVPFESEPQRPAAAGHCAKTVVNFLQYANPGAGNGSFIHRSIVRFIFRAGRRSQQRHQPVVFQRGGQLV